MVLDPTKAFLSSYEIQVASRIAAERADWFNGMALTVKATPDGATITTLSGTLADQAALFGVLNRIRDLGLKLISVTLIEPRSSTHTHTPLVNLHNRVFRPQEAGFDYRDTFLSRNCSAALPCRHQGPH
jgi:hypothetical protein